MLAENARLKPGCEIWSEKDASHGDMLIKIDVSLALSKHNFLFLSGFGGLAEPVSHAGRPSTA